MDWLFLFPVVPHFLQQGTQQRECGRTVRLKGGERKIRRSESAAAPPVCCSPLNSTSVDRPQARISTNATLLKTPSDTQPGWV